MPITRSPDNFNQVIEWTDEINEVENQYGVLNSENIFDVKPTSQTAILFDKNTHTITLLPDADRKTRQPSYGKDRDTQTFSLPLAFFNHFDAVTAEDIQGWRKSGTADESEAVDAAIAEKLEDMRMAVDQTHEYMKIAAIKGVSITPEGTTLANMFTEFSISLKAVDFDLGTATTNVDAKIAEVKRHVASNLKGAGPLQGIDLLVDASFFDKLINHPKVKEVYLNSQSNTKYQNDLSKYMPWGVSDIFEMRGVRFMTYDATFNLPDGTTDTAFATDEGYTVIRARGMYRGYVGPNIKLSGANQPGAAMFAWQYRDPKDEYHEMQVQSSPLFFATKPGAIVRVHTST